MLATVIRWSFATLFSMMIGGGVAYFGHEDKAVAMVDLTSIETASKTPSQRSQYFFEDIGEVVDGTVKNAHDPVLRNMSHGGIIEGHTKRRMLLFTFDDGPNAFTTPKLLDSLDRWGIKAVFFLTSTRFGGKGQRQAKQSALVQEIVQRGHFIGNHTHNHQQLPMLSEEEARQEIIETAKRTKRLIGDRPFLFRPPGGARSPRVDALLSRMGYTQMLWNLGSGDVFVEESAEVTRTWMRVLRQRIREGDRGGIILMHDTYARSVDAFDDIVRGIYQMNCELLAQENEELYDIVDHPRFFFHPDAKSEAGVHLPAEMQGAEFERRQSILRAKMQAWCASSHE